jgi:hypothetical protein
VGTDKYVFDPSEKTQAWGVRNFDPVKNHVFPIHSSIINKSNGILKQNEGW